jgi:hypothetical protein
MNSDEARARLESLLRDAGVDKERPSAGDVPVTWRVFQEFALEPVLDCEPRDQDGDLILAQFGTFDWGEGECFELDLTRQFSFLDENGEYDHMAQLSCTFLFEPTDDLRSAGAGSAWSGSKPLDDFFVEALALPGFKLVNKRQFAPLRLQIEYSNV